MLSMNNKKHVDRYAFNSITKIQKSNVGIINCDEPVNVYGQCFEVPAMDNERRSSVMKLTMS